MKKKPLILFLVILLLLVNVFTLPAQQLQNNFRHFTPNEGLSNDYINDIVQDRKGFMWLATNFGLNRFDGVSLQQYFYNRKDSTSLSSNFVMALHEDQKKRLWVGTFNGLNCLNTQLQQFARYQPLYRIIKIKEDRSGKIWVATSKGLKIADTVTHTLSPVHAADTALDKLLQLGITDIFYNANDRFYISGNYGVVIMNSNTSDWQLINNHASTGKLIESNDVQAITVDNKNRLWIATDETFSSLHMIDADRKVSRRVEFFKDKAGKQKPNRILNLSCDSKGRLWMTTTDFGLTMYQPQTNECTSYLHNPLQPGSIASNQCTNAFFSGNDGLVWVGISGYGVDYFNPDRLLFSTIEPDPFVTPTLLNNWARAVAEDNHNNLWLATGRGVTVYNKTKGVIRNFENSNMAKPSLHSGSVRSLLDDKAGNIWIGTASGLNKYNVQTGNMRFYTPNDSLPYLFVHTLYKTSGGKILVGGNGGLYEYLPATDNFFDFKKIPALKNIANKVIPAIKEDRKGYWWLGTSFNGVFVYDPIRSIVIKSIHVDTIDGISDNTIQSLFEDGEGNMWIGTRNGLNCFNIKTSKITVYGNEQGLLNTHISGIQQDKTGRLWVGTGKGLFVLSKDKKSFYEFNLSDGLATTQFNDQQAYAISNGQLIFPSRKGFLTFNPDAFNWIDENPKVYITGFTVPGVEKHSLTEVENLNNIALAPTENFFTIKLRALNYLNPEQCLYAYKLEGFDKDWIYTNNPVANYTNVPPGEYRFKYKASNSRDFLAVPEKSMDITISNVFYKTWWFNFLILLFILASFIGFYRYRIKQKEMLLQLESKAQLLEKEKALVMYENLKQHLNPHFLFNSLTSLSSLIRIDGKMAGNFLDKMSKVYRYILKNRDNEVVPLGEEIKFVQLYNDLQRIRFEHALEINLNIDEEYYHRKIAPVTLQNLVENAIKHNTADVDAPLVIDLFIADDYLVVQNNLQRKNYVETSNKQGLANMESLYTYLSNRKMIIEESNHFFTVRVPLI